MAKKKIQYKNIIIKGFEELEKDNTQVEQADVSVLASTEDTDRDLEVIKQDGIDLTHFKNNPVILFAHKYSEPPIGKAVGVKITDAGLQIDIKFASKKANPMGPQVKQLMKEGILKAVSIGFIPKERDENDPRLITKSEMLELSVVPVPANPHALALAMKKGFAKELFEEEKPKEKGGHKPEKPRKPKIKTDKNISSVSEKSKEPNGKKNPTEGVERSHNGSGVTVELPREVVVDLRKETLKVYKQSELVLSLTKSILQKMNENEKKQNK